MGRPDREEMEAARGNEVKRTFLILFLLLFPALASAQLTPFSDIVLTSRGTPAGGALVSVCGNPGLATTAASVTSNIAILTMSSNPITAGFFANMTLIVSGFIGGDTYFNGTFTILTVTSTTVTYALTHANASAGTNGSAFQTGNASTACAPLSTIYSDSGGLVPITQPGFAADGLGNYQFYAASGTYNIQFYGPVLVVRVKPVVLPFSSSANTTLTGNLTLTGNDITTGTWTAMQLSGCQHVNANQTFAQALAVGGVTCITVDPGTYTVAVNATVPTTVGLAFSKGGLPSIATGVTLIVNSPIYASPDAQIFTYVGTGTATLGGNNSVAASPWFPGVDPCSQINNALLALQAGSSTNGGFVDARHYTTGAQACASNPFAGITIAFNLLLGHNTFQITAQWVLPQGAIVVGMGRGNNVPPLSGSSVIEAVVGFPINTPLVKNGTNAYGTRLQDLIIDCNNISGTGGFLNATGQEQTSVRNVLFQDCPAIGFDLETTQDSGPYEHLEFLYSTACTNCSAATLPVKVNPNGPFRDLRDITINATGAGFSPSIGISIPNGFPGLYESIHIEGVTTG